MEEEHKRSFDDSEFDSQRELNFSLESQFANISSQKLLRSRFKKMIDPVNLNLSK